MDAGGNGREYLREQSDRWRLAAQFLGVGLGEPWAISTFHVHGVVTVGLVEDLSICMVEKGAANRFSS